MAELALANYAAEMSMNTPNGPGKATRREWIGLAIIALPCVLYAMEDRKSVV